MKDLPIRVLHVVGGMGSGGLETMIMNWYRNIDRTKVQFDFLVHHNEKCFYDEEIEEMGGHIYHCSLSNDHNFFKYTRDLDAFFREHAGEYKIVHGHHSTYGCFYLRAAKKAGIPYRISHSHIASFTRSFQGYSFYLLSRLYKTNANIHFACSRAAGAYMYGDGSKFEVINNGIDIDNFYYSEERRNAIRIELGIEGKTTLVHVGRFHDQKNHTFLIDIFSQYMKVNPQSVLLLIGVGPLQESVKKKVNDLGLKDDVFFLDQRSNVYDYLSASDVFVFPSLYEGLPLTLVEAQSSGLPIVCSDTITDETRLTDSYYTLSLNTPVVEWANLIEKIRHIKIDRSLATSIVKSKGFDSKDVAKMIEGYYINLLYGKEC